MAVRHRNLAAFHRGQLLFYMCKFVKKGDAKTFWPRRVRMSYTTVYRYITFARLIMNYPKLLVCDLEFGQFTTHNTRFIEYLKKDTKLAAKLMTPLNIIVRDIPLEIRVENVSLDLVKFKETPDIALYEYFMAGTSESSFYSVGMEAMCVDDDVIELEVENVTLDNDNNVQ
jgi:hypothetical protein